MWTCFFSALLMCKWLGVVVLSVLALLSQHSVLDCEESKVEVRCLIIVSYTINRWQVDGKLANKNIFSPVYFVVKFAK